MSTAEPKSFKPSARDVMMSKQFSSHIRRASDPRRHCSSQRFSPLNTESALSPTEYALCLASIP